MGSAGHCTGCLRTLDEIAAWSTMSAERQWAVIARLAALEDRSRQVAEDVINRIKTHIATSPAVLFMKGTPDFPQCGFSAQAVAALRASGANAFHAVNIFEDPELREALKKFSNWPTYPQLYVNGELVGGCDIVLDMHRSGELKKILSEAGAA
jgi:monothiol glutaredoxin